MARKTGERTAKLYARDLELGKGVEVEIKGYDTAGAFVCSLRISRAGVGVWAGSKGNRFVCDLNWESLVRRLEG
jgi:hypothetical protein